MRMDLAVKDYLVDIEIRKYSPRTVQSYKLKLRQLVQFCESIGVDDTDELTMGVIKQFTHHMMSKGNKGSYINGILKTTKSFIQYCYNEDYGGFNTRNKSFKWVKEEKAVIRAFTPRDVKTLLSNCKGLDFLSIRDTAILTTFFETGIRCFELCQIKKEDIREDFILINGKNSKQRVVPITPVLRKALMRYDRVREEYFRYKSTDEYYFLSFSGKMLNNGAVDYMIKRRGKGIEGIRVSPHTCRHFFAQQQIKMGTDIYTISRLLGHENIAITQIYLTSLQDSEIVRIAKGNSVLMNM